MNVFVYGDNVNTDVIIPARYLTTSEPGLLAAHCMEDIDSAFASMVRPGDVVVAGRNFGCGSSREHAPLALKASGVSCIVAASFARIFFRNAVNIGLPVLENPEAAENINPGDEILVDTDAGMIHNLTTNRVFSSQPLPPFVREIVRAGGLLGRLKGAVPSTKRVAVLPGDGVGPEVTAQAVDVLTAVGKRFGHDFSFTPAPIGGYAIDSAGMSLPEATLSLCLRSDAVLLGAVGGPKWDALPEHLRPEAGLLALRRALNLFANLRPAKLYPCLCAASPLKESHSGGVFDILIVRELTGGLYYGPRGLEKDKAYDTMVYTQAEVERIGRLAFALARTRRGKLTSVDKANVLDTSRLWRTVMGNLHEKEFPDVDYRDMLVDNAAMQLIRCPADFDVLVTENTFGDILSDEAGMLTGSIGLLPSASLGNGSFGLYEPVHGSAPDIAGSDVANPLAAIMSCALMLRYSMGLSREAVAVEEATAKVLAGHKKTADLAVEASGDEIVGTAEMGQLVCENILSSSKGATPCPPLSR